MIKVKFKLSGCDDETIMEMEVTELEFDFLKRVSELSHETSEYGCMPRLNIVERCDA